MKGIFQFKNLQDMTSYQKIKENLISQFMTPSNITYILIGCDFIVSYDIRTDKLLVTLVHMVRHIFYFINILKPLYFFFYGCSPIHFAVCIINNLFLFIDLILFCTALLGPTQINDVV